METNQRLKQDLHVLRTKRSKAILFHILSPLDQAAMHHGYQPFIYKLDGARIYISERVCKHLANLAMHRAELLLCAVEEQKAAQSVPDKLRGVFSDPRIILALYPRLRNQLCNLNCCTLLDIMHKGRSYFADEQKFSVRAMQTLDALFEKYNCRKLFK